MSFRLEVKGTLTVGGEHPGHWAETHTSVPSKALPGAPGGIDSSYLQREGAGGRWGPQTVSRTHIQPGGAWRAGSGARGTENAWEQPRPVQAGAAEPITGTSPGWGHVAAGVWASVHLCVSQQRSPPSPLLASMEVHELKGEGTMRVFKSEVRLTVHS